jgi:hypothetical protein
VCDDIHDDASSSHFVQHLERIVEPPAASHETEKCCLGGACGQSATVPGVLVARVLRRRQTAAATGGALARDGLAVMRRGLCEKYGTTQLFCVTGYVLNSQGLQGITTLRAGTSTT